jgi:hypothetical protein
MACVVDAKECFNFGGSAYMPMKAPTKEKFNMIMEDIYLGFEKSGEELLVHIQGHHNYQSFKRQYFPMTTLTRDDSRFSGSHKACRYERGSPTVPWFQ